MHWDDPELLAVELTALPALDNAAVEAAQEDWLIDEVHPGAPLLITFSCVVWSKTPPFNLFGRSRKMEGVTGRKLNHIMLRDPNFNWFMHGIAGFGNDVDTVVETLKKLIAVIRPSEVWCVGDSIGGCAAAMFGVLLQADRIVSNSPMSRFDADRSRLFNE